MVKKTSYQKCYNLALYYLAKRQHSIKEIQQKLKDKEHNNEDIQKVTQKLVSLNFLDDKEFAFARVRYRYETSRWGLTRIKIELKQKGIEQYIIEDVIEQRYEDGTLNDDLINQQAYDLAYSRYKNKVEYLNNRLTAKSYAKVASFLQRRGYSNDQIKYVINLFNN